MAYVTITINGSELAKTHSEAKLIVHFPVPQSTEVSADRPELYVLRPASAEKILNLIKEEVGHHLLQSKTSFTSGFNKLFPPEHQLLSNKEKAVLQLLTKGHSYKMIADELGKSVETIRVQIKSIYRKLKVCSNTQAVIKSREEQLL